MTSCLFLMIYIYIFIYTPCALCCKANRATWPIDARAYSLNPMHVAFVHVKHCKHELHAAWAKLQLQTTSLCPNNVAIKIYALFGENIVRLASLEPLGKKTPASCRAHEIMRMMWCDGSQSSVSQMNFLLHGSVWLQSMDSNPSASCRAYEIMRMNNCVVEHKTV